MKKEMIVKIWVRYSHTSPKREILGRVSGYGYDYDLEISEEFKDPTDEELGEFAKRCDEVSRRAFEMPFTEEELAELAKEETK